MLSACILAHHGLNDKASLFQILQEESASASTVTHPPNKAIATTSSPATDVEEPVTTTSIAGVRTAAHVVGTTVESKPSNNNVTASDTDEPTITTASGISTHSTLFGAEQRAILRRCLPRTHCIQATTTAGRVSNDNDTILQKLAELFQQLYVGAIATEPLHRNRTTWLLKGGTSNNATQVYVIDSLEAVQQVLEKLRPQKASIVQSDSTPKQQQQQRQPAQLSAAWVIQEYVHRPLLLYGKYKFHLRCNALVVGTQAVYVHRTFVCHAATEVRN